ncbi:CLUMA_CG017593, isoform A [Clunio marinus]|uniref:CLUMA_CG017593, isoform A n=1 Tax=Clunio marinus TaxID=568069 RepID=A0A1J1IZC2_9DIPT|nr:CLUMA_CG017593, isoform A [Clunio marinus]
MKFKELNFDLEVESCLSLIVKCSMNSIRDRNIYNRNEDANGSENEYDDDDVCDGIIHICSISHSMVYICSLSRKDNYTMTIQCSTYEKTTLKLSQSFEKILHATCLSVPMVIFASLT